MLTSCVGNVSESYELNNSYLYFNTIKVPSGCVIGKNHGIASNVDIKKSAIGADCILAQNVKVIDSVLMDKVKVEEG